MTIPPFDQTEPYVIQGVGPYAISHPYEEGAIVARIVDGSGTLIDLDMEAITVTPTSSDATGDLLLSAALAAEHAGRTMWIDRDTSAIQGWEARYGDREVGVETQLDREVMAIQELKRQMRTTLRTTTEMAAYQPEAGHVPVVNADGTGWANGPATATIDAALVYAQLAQDAAAAAVATVAGSVGFGSLRVIYAEAGVTGFNVYPTINAALAEVLARFPATGAYGFRAVIVCTGAFDEQVLRIPDGVVIKGSSLGSFEWTYSGDRSVNNFVCRPGIGCGFQEVRWWLSTGNAEETVVIDDASQFVSFVNCNWLSAGAGEVIPQGIGKARSIYAFGEQWPKTILMWDCLIDDDSDGDRSAYEGAITLVNTSGTTKFADFRAYNLNIDAFYQVHGSCLFAENLTDVNLMSPHLMGMYETETRAAVRLRNTNPGSTQMFIIVQGNVVGHQGKFDIGDGVVVSLEYFAQAARCTLSGSGELRARTAEGAMVRKWSSDAFPVTNDPSVVNADGRGNLLLKMGQYPNNYLHYSCRTIPATDVSIVVRLSRGYAIVDVGSRYGVVLRNPSSGDMYFFGVRAGSLLVVEHWSSDGLLLGDVIAPLSVLSPPETFGIWRSGDTTGFALPDLAGAMSYDVHTMMGLQAYTQAGFAGSAVNVQLDVMLTSWDNF